MNDDMVKLARGKELPIVSACCGIEMPDYPDRDICPRCGEHTGVEIIQEEGEMTLEQEIHTLHLEAGLKAACKRIADGGQIYEEANTAEGWFEFFMSLPLKS